MSAKAPIAAAACHGWATSARNSSATKAATAAMIARAIARCDPRRRDPACAEPGRRKPPVSAARGRGLEEPERAGDEGRRPSGASAARRCPASCAAEGAAELAEHAGAATTKTTGTATSRTSVNGSRSCSRAKTPSGSRHDRRRRRAARRCAQALALGEEMADDQDSHALLPAVLGHLPEAQVGLPVEPGIGLVEQQQRGSCRSASARFSFCGCRRTAPRRDS